MQSKWIKVVCFLSALLFLTAYAQPDEESDSQKLPTPLEQIKKLLPSVSYEMLGEFPCLVYSNTSSGRATIYRVINPIFTGDQVSVLKLELDQESKKLRIEKRTISQDDFADMQKDPILTVLKEVYPESEDFSYRISGIESLEKLAAV
ncbi:MAG: hypothetical protein HYS98_00035, partial [Deltaproteobacteria bacterium]|nr:hypothetical protein [Deltaproteobacteria bacterium]